MSSLEEGNDRARAFDAASNCWLDITVRKAAAKQPHTAPADFSRSEMLAPSEGSKAAT